ncbi:MAG: AbrB family transcriptional regulator [Thermoprotei archaeon]|nr:MAG: AbrB family transcriptional regulator [Thermoprotei archaeon]
MGRVKVTEKYQVTIPKDVRNKIGLNPGEIVEVSVLDENTIVIKRFRIKEPLKLLIGDKALFNRHIPVEEVEEAAEE